MRLRYAIGLVAVLVGGSAVAEPVTLKFGGQVPSSSPTYKGVIKVWIDTVNAASDGTLNIEFYGDAKLSKNGDGYDRIEGGIVDIVWDNTTTYGQRFQSFQWVRLPGMYTDEIRASAAAFRAYQKGVFGKEMADNKKLRPLIFLVAPQSVLFLKEEPKDINDLTGLKIAVTSKQHAILVEAMGGVPVVLNTPEYYPAIQKGVVDGGFSSVNAVAAFKMQDLLHYYLYGPFGGGQTTIVMGQEQYDALPDKAKKAIDDNSYAEGSRVWATNQHGIGEEAFQSFMTDPQNKKADLPDPPDEKWLKAFDPAIKEFTDSVANGHEIIDGFKKEYAATK